jgi:hypothetical protein
MKHKIIIALISLLFLACLIIFLKAKQKPVNIETSVKSITQKTKIIDINDDHNQALDVINYAKSNGINAPKILINFDTHSDIYINRRIIGRLEAQVFDWVNVYIAQNPQVEKIYWVMPEEETKNTAIMYLFWENEERDLVNGFPFIGNCIKNFDYLRWVFYPPHKKPYIQNMKIDPKTAVINEYVANYKLNNLLFPSGSTYKNIKIITCTTKTLPDFSGENVFLSIDADYLSNSGFDTVNDFKFKKTSRQMDNALNQLFETIEQKNIQPEIISMTMSPQYLPKKHYQKVFDFFKKVEDFSGKQDALKTYHYQYKDFTQDY